jgi:hypothetical protein
MNPAELAADAVTLANLAEKMKPPTPQHKHANHINLINYHLRTAARLTRELAEASTEK